MHWIVQNNVFNEARYQDVLHTLERGGIEHSVVKVLAFSHELVPEPEVQGPIAVLGSYGLVKAAHARGWGPGVFYSDQIDFRVYAEIFGADLLNFRSRICRFGDVRLSEASFLRPSDDSKDFAGAVFEPAEFEDWQKRVCGIEGFSTLNADTLVVVAPVQEIYAECRFFVVEGQVVTASRYKMGGDLSQSAEIPPEMMDAARRFIARWEPDRAYVLDLGLTPGGVKVIEYNNINSAGWYHADVSKVIQAIDALSP